MSPPANLTRPSTPPRVRPNRVMAVAFAVSVVALGAIAAIPALAAPPSGWGLPEVLGGQGGDSNFAKTPVAALNAEDDAIVAWATPERVGRQFRDRIIVRFRVGQRGSWGPTVRLGFGKVEAVDVSRRHGRLVVWRTGAGQLVAARNLGRGPWRSRKVARLSDAESGVRDAGLLTDGGAALVVEFRRRDQLRFDDAAASRVATFVQAGPTTTWRRPRPLLTVPPPGLDAAAVNERGQVLLAADFAGAGRASLTPRASRTWAASTTLADWNPVAPADLPPGADPSAFLPRVTDLQLDRRGRSVIGLTTFPTATTTSTQVLLSSGPPAWRTRLTLAGAARIAWTGARLAVIGQSLGALGPDESGVVATPLFQPLRQREVLSPDPLTILVRHPANEDGAPRTPFHVAVAENGRTAAMWNTVEGPGPNGVDGTGHGLGQPWQPVVSLGRSRTFTQLVAGGHSALALIDMSEGGTGLVVRRFDGLARFLQIGARRSDGRLILRLHVDRAATLRGLVRSRDTGRVRRVPTTSLATGRRRVDIGPLPAGRYALRLALCIPTEGCAPGRRLLNVR